MIPAARSTVPSVAITIFTLKTVSSSEILKSGDLRMYELHFLKIVIITGRDCWSAAWIKSTTYFVRFLPRLDEVHSFLLQQLVGIKFVGWFSATNHPLFALPYFGCCYDMTKSHDTMKQHTNQLQEQNHSKEQYEN